MKSKKNRYRILAVILIPLVIICIVLLLMAFLSLRNLTDQTSGEISLSIAEYDYHLRAQPTALQEELFDELTAALNAEEVDQELCAELVVENFVADFYTWTNKHGQYDVGGMYYVYSDQKVNIYNEARDGFYKGINNAINEYGKDEVLEVASVEASAARLSGGYELVDADGASLHYSDAFNVDCTFTYKDNAMDTSGLSTRQSYIVIRDAETGRYEIVEAIGETYEEAE